MQSASGRRSSQLGIQYQKVGAASPGLETMKSGVERVGLLLTSRSSEPMRVIEVSKEEHYGEGAGETAASSGTMPTYEHPGVTRPGIQPGSPRGSPVCTTLSFRRSSILTSITLIGARDFAVTCRHTLFQHSAGTSLLNSSGCRKGCLLTRPCYCYHCTLRLRFNWKRWVLESCTNATLFATYVVLLHRMKKPLTNGIVRHDSHMRKSGVTRPGIESGSPRLHNLICCSEPYGTTRLACDQRSGNFPRDLLGRKGVGILVSTPPRVTPGIHSTHNDTRRPHHQELFQVIAAPVTEGAHIVHWVPGSILGHGNLIIEKSHVLTRRVLNHNSGGVEGEFSCTHTFTSPLHRLRPMGSDDRDMTSTPAALENTKSTLRCRVHLCISLGDNSCDVQTYAGTRAPVAQLTRVSVCQPKVWQHAAPHLHSLLYCIKRVGWTPVGTPTSKSSAWESNSNPKFTKNRSFLKVTLAWEPNPSLIIGAVSWYATYLRCGRLWVRIPARSPPTKANRVQSPVGSTDFRKCESCAGRCRWSAAPSFRRRSILTSITLIGSQDLTVKSRQNPFTHSLRDGCTIVVSKLDMRSYLRSTHKTVALFVFRAGLGIEMKFVSNLLKLSVGNLDPRSAAIIDESEIQNHEISMVQHFYIGTKIKQDSGSELVSFDLGSGAMLDLHDSGGALISDEACQKQDHYAFPEAYRPIPQIAAFLRPEPLVHTVFGISWRTLAQSSPSTATADVQRAVNIVIPAHKTVDSSPQDSNPEPYAPQAGAGAHQQTGPLKVDENISARNHNYSYSHRGRGGVVVRLLGPLPFFSPRRTGFNFRRSRSRIFRMWESCRTVPLIDGFFRGSPVSPCPFIPLTSLHPHRLSRPRCQEPPTSLLSLIFTIAGRTKRGYCSLRIHNDVGGSLTHSAAHGYSHEAVEPNTQRLYVWGLILRHAPPPPSPWGGELRTSPAAPFFVHCHNSPRRNVYWGRVCADDALEERTQGDGRASSCPGGPSRPVVLSRSGPETLGSPLFLNHALRRPILRSR
ncbi:hypothetical protein PR048_026348 [Dryococelus australis]|uniref:Uncharacterized protein n=1 Tax=Dryococelus australis TaxID=614101 RepID=A0ABQ9GL30_9NEOP|nr:hypothetical protein PR048_026348 [Dryococelus australis]